MNIVCPHCHQPVTVNGLGRPKLDMPVINVYDAVQRYKTITAAARALGVSRGYVYRVLKDHGENIELPVTLPIFSKTLREAKQWH